MSAPHPDVVRWAYGGAEAESVFPNGHSARLIDAVLVGLIVVRVPIPALPVGLPTAQLAILLLIAIASFRPPVRSFAAARWYPLLCMGLIGYLAIESMINEADFVRRIGNIALLFALAGFMGSGRIDVASALKGLGTALAVNAGLFYAGVAPDAYHGVLTGYLQDKNAAALVYAIGALLVSIVVSSTWQRIVVLLAGGAAVLLTDSRTTMAAYGAGLIWLTVSPRLRGASRAVLGLLLFLAFRWANENLAEAGRYGIERVGSDALRERIDAAARLKTDLAPWYGHGLGEAYVQLDDRDWFFHNSYDALWTEGGLVLLVGMLALYLGAGLGLPGRRGRTYHRHAVAASTVTLLFCAFRLGEVFFAPVGMLVLGVGLALITAERPPGVEREPVSGGRKSALRSVDLG